MRICLAKSWIVWDRREGGRKQWSGERAVHGSGWDVAERQLEADW